ncbi:MAG: lysophospholipase, partial [Cyanobacteria bacterium]|nr:lysophospholipase [Cyanobacteriota bacterium]
IESTKPAKITDEEQSSQASKEDTSDKVKDEDKGTATDSGDQSKTKSKSDSSSTGNVVTGTERPKRKKGTIVRGNAPCLAWIDRSMPTKAVILCVHGLGLHNGTYEAFGKKMSQSGYAVYSIDVRGFGSWMAAQGRSLVDFDSCMADVKATLEVIHKAHRQVPVFLLGESMGGAIALKATSLYPELIDGLVSSVPAGDRFKQGRTSLKVALKLLSGNKDKPFNVGEGVIKQATEKPELRDAWLNDPFARMNLSPRELIQFQHFMNQNHESAKKITTTPVLIVQGCKDHLVRPEGTIELFNQLNTHDRKIVLLPKSEHLIFEEAQFNDDDLKILNEWLDSHVTGWKPRKKEDSVSKIRFSKKASSLNNVTGQASPAEQPSSKEKETDKAVVDNSAEKHEDKANPGP